MPLNLASPGIVVREVDLTLGRVNPTTNKTGGISAPFAQGPVELPTYVGNEAGLLNTFGKPYPTDKHYEHWMVASSYLAYGGGLRVVRSDDTQLKNSFSGSASDVKIKSREHYEQLGYDDNTISNVVAVSKNPGSWANGIRVAIIDGKADQTLTVDGNTVPGSFTVGAAVTQAITSTLPGIGETSELDGLLRGIISGVGTNTIDVKVLSYVTGTGSDEYNVAPVDYQPSGVYKFSSDTIATSTASTSLTAAVDWFDQQTVAISTATEGGTIKTTTIKWNGLAERPGTSTYATARGSRFDEVSVVVIDGEGKVTGNSGTILEKHLNLSKAKDGEFSVGSPSNWRKFLKTNSEFVYGGSSPAGLTTIGFAGTTTTEVSDTAWDQNTEGIIFGACGNQNLQLETGNDYGGGTNILADGALEASIAKLSTGYKLFENTDNYSVDFLLMGSANYAKEDAQALANQVISVADVRKDALAFISPYRKAYITDTTSGSVTVNSDEAITDNVIGFYAPLTSSTYAVFDSGYKYMFDRFNDTFRYVPLNGDIAGTCARNDINNLPWFSPAGTSRGAILNAVKLAYNPSKVQRDRLYSNRINPVIFSPGAGIILFGDKTGYGKSSAFDRINVRRLFIFLEDSISAAAKDQLFEFNDSITRTNFVNVVEPFLRDVQSKRGIFDFRVICDESNNTAAIIDNNEFVADIYIKPARSINFIGLTFVATRTGVSFEEVIGSV